METHPSTPHEGTRPGAETVCQKWLRRVSCGAATESSLFATCVEHARKCRLDLREAWINYSHFLTPKTLIKGINLHFATKLFQLFKPNTQSLAAGYHQQSRQESWQLAAECRDTLARLLFMLAHSSKW